MEHDPSRFSNRDRKNLFRNRALVRAQGERTQRSMAGRLWQRAPAAQQQEAPHLGDRLKIQERAFGGLKPSVIRVLEHASEDSGSRQIARLRKITRASTGTVLIREWQGKSHHVTVLERGVLYRKKNYRSLSQVARVITGCRWSGPLFFGLRGRSKERSRGTH